MKTKKKNQNKIIKIAAALMILCLMTTCAISATFAKYATTDSTEDTARVAKWGVVLSASGTLFGKNYATKTTDASSDKIIALGDSHTATTHSVVANDKVVAPGTKNDVGVLLKLNGQPEVAFSVEATTSNNLKDICLKKGTYGVMVEIYGVNAATDFDEDERPIYTYNSETKKYTQVDAYDEEIEHYYELQNKVTVGENGYYPVVWTLTKNDAKVNDYSTVTALTNAIRTDVNGTADDGAKKVYDANHALDDTYKITWAWEFNNGNDGADTILGNIGHTTVVELGEDNTTYSAISADSYSLNVAFNITISAEQID